MHPRSFDGCSVASTFLDGEPPVKSRLAQSLNRRRFADTFGEWHTVGRGGYGTVVKAWHLKECRWYAIKLINTKVRAEESPASACTSWCGPEIFDKLSSLGSPHVVKYQQYWAELPSDLPCVGLSTPVPSPKFQPALPKMTLPPLESDPADLRSDASQFSSSSESIDMYDLESDGFEWDRRSQKSIVDSEATFARASSSTPKCKYYKVVILEQMEYVEGVTLSAWLAKPDLRPRLCDVTGAGGLLEQLMRGLTDLHSAGIVHCDLKPSNVMITGGGQLKIFDFGTAKHRSSAQAMRRIASRTPLTLEQQDGASTALGTPGYAPPEHCYFPMPLPLRRQRSESGESGLLFLELSRSKLAGSSVDIFSAGVIVMEMLMTTVRKGPAWHTEMEKAKALAQIRSPTCRALPSALFQAPEIDAWMRHLVLRMAVWDGQARPSASEILFELEASLAKPCRQCPFIDARRPYRRTPRQPSSEEIGSASDDEEEDLDFLDDLGSNKGDEAMRSPATFASFSPPKVPARPQFSRSTTWTSTTSTAVSATAMTMTKSKTDSFPALLPTAHSPYIGFFVDHLRRPSSALS